MDVINVTGRRKTAVARIYMKPGSGEIIINKRAFSEYFPVATLQYVVRQPLELTDNLNKYDIKAILEGGGYKGQAEALRLAISKALVEVDPEYRAALKPIGLLRRDPRMVERKKPGQKKARKRFQFSKR